VVVIVVIVVTSAASPELRAVQDLVGIGVTDAAEEMRVGERALQGMVLALQAHRERFEIGVEHLEPSGVHRRG